MLVGIISYSGEVQHATRKVMLQYMHDHVALDSRCVLVTYINPFQYFETPKTHNYTFNISKRGPTS